MEHPIQRLIESIGGLAVASPAPASEPAEGEAAQTRMSEESGKEAQRRRAVFKVIEGGK